MGVGARLSRSEDVRSSPNPDQLCSSLISPRLRISLRQDVSSGVAPCCSLYLLGIRDLLATLGNAYNWSIATHTGKNVGWALIALVLYGNLLSDSKRRKRSLESRRSDEEETFEMVHRLEEDEEEMVHRLLHKSQNVG